MLSGKLRWSGSRRATGRGGIVRSKLNGLNPLNLRSEHTHALKHRE
jgi:hypothetical protein